ncbi:MAG: hypothetical protein Ct9H90mP25_6320 [Gammaproteobacteria bacterium]|nr:MAG: hypothetical protein Ct9H90mP25_6320 [Gammaproteobacteria bacterium]
MEIFKQSLYLTGINEEGYRDDSGVDQQKASWLYEYTLPNEIKMEGGFTYNNLNQETAGYVAEPRHTRTAIKEEQTLTQRPIATVKALAYGLDSPWSLETGNTLPLLIFAK